MGKREAFALVAIPFVVAAIVWLPPPIFLAALGAAILIAADELLTMARGAGYPVGRWLPLAATAGVLASCWTWGCPYLRKP